MLQYLFTFVALASVIVNSNAFTLQTTPRRISTSRSSITQSASCLKMSVCDLASPVLVDRDTNVYKIHKSRHADVYELNDEIETWALQLSNDSTNTRGYICRCLVEVAGLSEADSYGKMVQAHEHGEAIIGEYCQEHAEHYKNALLSSGMDCEIFPIDDWGDSRLKTRVLPSFVLQLWTTIIQSYSSHMYWSGCVKATCTDRAV